MVMEAAKLAMPNTKVVDEDGNPKVVYHGGQFGITNFIPKRNMHFGTKKAAMQRILDSQWGYDNWLVQNEDGSYSWKYEDEYDEAYNVQSNKTFATEEEAMEDALLYLGDEVVVKPYFLNIRNIKRTDDAQSSWDDAIEVVKAESDNVDGIVYENWYEDKGSDSYIAFNPNQIKSATENVGTFDANNPDIRYSLSIAPTQTLTTPNGEMVADVNEAQGQAKLSLRTWEEGGREVLVDFLASREEDNALTPAEAQEMMQQMDDIYTFCKTMKGKYTPFGKWSEVNYRSFYEKLPCFSIIYCS
jgi:hypothetical protein